MTTQNRWSKCVLVLMLSLGSSFCLLGQPFNAGMFMAAPAAFNDNTVPSTIRFADVNGDGYPDVCYAIPEQGEIYCALYTNGQFGTPTLWSFNFQSTLTKTCTNPTVGSSTCTMTTQWVDPSVWETIQYVDVNGDGKADVCGRTPYGFECRLSTGHDFFGAVLGTSDFSNKQDIRWFSDPSYYDTIRVVDIDNNGRPDVCGRNSQGIICDLQWADGSRFCDPDDVGCTVYGFDFGDNAHWNSDPAYWSTLQFADINGDRYLDVCGRGQAGMICATYNPTQVLIEKTQTYQVWSLVFDQVKVWTTQFNDSYGWKQRQYYRTIRLVDIDGDHKADVCGRGDAGFYCAVSNGSSFQGGFSVVANNFSDGNGWNQEDHYQNMIWIRDFNGDGSPDICGRGSGGIICQLQQRGPYAPFSAPVQWVNNFGDNFGWGNSVAYWGTVQLVKLPRPGWPGWAFCGRGVAGIWCTSFVPIGATL